MTTPCFPSNWFAGWSMVLAAFASGAVIGLFFHRDDFLGGYASFQRRILRLGHIALAALGLMNVLYSLSPWPDAGSTRGITGSVGLLIGGLTMPAVCFLTSWRPACRHLFFIPVASLVVAAVSILLGGMS